MDEQSLTNLLVECGIEGIIRRNNNLQALCPFHKERSPSWGISLTEPHPHGCFSCGARGVLKTLLENSGNFSKKQIASITNQIANETPIPLFEKKVTASATIDYRLLFPFSLDSRAYRYLRRRGVPDFAARHAHCLYDHFQRRVLFPWYLFGVLVGVTGRAVDNNKVRTLPYFATQKGLSFYLPSGEIGRGALILTEGEIDALKIYATGFHNVGAIGFGQFTQQHKNLVLNFSDAVITFFDDDKTGRRLTRKVIDDLQGLVPVHRVNYKRFRARYKDKLDPGLMSRADIRLALSKHLIRNADWPKF